MRNPHLLAALKEYSSDAGATLGLQRAQGAEIPFELAETGGRRRGASPLICYRPLTRVFLDQHEDVLRRLPTREAAARILETSSGLESYLVERGITRVAAHPRERADAALALFLEALFDGRTDFSIDPARFDAAYEQLERALYEATCETVVVTVLRGLALDPATDELDLGDGLSIRRAGEVAGVPEDALAGPRGEDSTLLVLRLADDRSQPQPVAVARARFARLLTALRLYEPGCFALGPVAWSRRDAGAWRTLALGGSGRTGRLYTLPADQEDELRAFANLVSRRTPTRGEVAWALRRFEMGCERLTSVEGLTDHLLALRALLEPEGPSSGRLAQRLAMICAAPQDRAGLAARVARALDLQDGVIAGDDAPDAGGMRLIDELSEHLRAILRDVLCGHLHEDVVALADDLLAEAAGPEEGPELYPDRCLVPQGAPGVGGEAGDPTEPALGALD